MQTNYKITWMKHQHNVKGLLTVRLFMYKENAKNAE